VTKRKRLSVADKVAIFVRHNECCHICGLSVVGKPWEVEHIIPLALGGADDESNWAPAHKACHAPKTAEDVADIARAKRREAKHLGIRKRSSFPKPPPGYKYDWGQRRLVKETA
jgi:5-methylcytosine-specific restriction protein A